MTKMRKILCVVTAIAVMFTMSSVSVLALDEPAATADDQVTTEAPVADDVEDTTEATEPTEGTTEEGEAVEAAEETVQAAAGTLDTAIPSDPINIRLESGAGRIHVNWNVDSKFQDSTSGCDPANYVYKIYREDYVTTATPSNIWGSKSLTTTNREIAKVEASAIANLASYEYVDVVSSQKVVHTTATMPSYKYTVVLVNSKDFDYDSDSDGTADKAYLVGEYELKSNSAEEQPVQQAYVAVKLKVKKTLSSHKGKKAKRTFSSGTGLLTTGYGSAKYQFWDDKGSYFYVMRIATKNAKTYRQPKDIYTREEAQNYVNESGVSSSTKYMIWVSEYCQHAYMFTGKKGSWTCIDDWKVSTGKANTPSPTGSKTLHKKLKTRHGIKCWNCYSSLNALHGVKSYMVKYLGDIKSNGCIRNPNDKAKKIYNTCPKKTRILVY